MDDVRPRILVVEDDEAHAEAIRRVLETAGMAADLRVAGTLSDFRACIALDLPDIALLDLNLPDGRAVEVLTSPPEAGAFPVLIMTSYGDERTAVEALKAGALDYVAKSPETFADLPHILARSLREWKLLRERKCSEIELHESEERFSAAFHRFPTPAAISEIETGAFLEVNRQFETTLGFSREEVIGKTSLELGFMTAEIRAKLIEILERTGRLTGFEYQVLAKDGRQVDCAYYAEPIKVGGRRRLLSMLVDVTERKRHEADRETMLSLLRLLNAPSDLRELMREVTKFLQEWSGCDAVGIRMRDGDDFPYYETSGFTAEFVEAETRLCAVDVNRQILRDAESEPVLECVCGAVLSGRTDKELPWFTGNGSFWTNSTSDLLTSKACADLPASTRGRCWREGYESMALVPLRFAGLTLGLLQLNCRRKGWLNAGLIGLLERAAASLATALQQRRAQAALRASEERFRAIADYTPECETWFSPEGKLLWINPAAESLTGYSAAESAAMPDFPLSLIHEEDRAVNRASFADALKGGTGTDVEFRLISKCGSTKWCAASYQPIFDSDGRPMGHRNSMRDITRRKKAEEERARLEEQFRQAQKLESLGRLAGGVAHDFNNLLTVINGYSDLVLKCEDVNATVRRSVTEVRKAGERAAQLTQQLLAISRKQLIEPKPVNLNQLISESRNLLERLIGEHIELVTNLAPALGQVMADPGQLHQVLMNLAVNARDAMPDGGRLTIETASVELDSDSAVGRPGLAPGPHVLLAVADTGVGMDEEVRRHLFEPFFTTKGEDIGTGLGLSTAYGIVRQCGGTIQVDSQPGQGAIFEIYLPRVEALAAVEKSALPAPTTLRGSETVLVVEDLAEVRELTVEVLKTYGYQVLEAGTASEALLLAESHPGPIHLLLTDVVMPGMTGKDLWDRLEPLLPNTRVLYMSGYADNIIAPSGSLDPVVDFIAKPFSPHSLALKVRTALGSPNRPGRILVVDDDEGIRALFEITLTEAGYEVFLASDGAQALAMVEADEFDLVLTDLVMPNREGIETIQALKAIKPGMKIIAVSGAFGGGFLKVAELVGADATLAKPVNPDRLLASVRAVLD